MYMQNKKIEHIWMPAATCSLYPVLQIPPDKKHLKGFAWFDYVRPSDPEDVFNWRGKSKESVLVMERKHNVPLQKLNKNGAPANGQPAEQTDTSGLPEASEPSEQSEPSGASEPSEPSELSDSPKEKHNNHLTMALFKTMKPRAYRHEYIYYNERKESE